MVLHILGGYAYSRVALTLYLKNDKKVNIYTFNIKIINL